MGFAEGLGTIIGMFVSYLITQDMTIAIITGIMCIALMMKGDND